MNPPFEHGHSPRARKAALVFVLPLGLLCAAASAPAQASPIAHVAHPQAKPHQYQWWDIIDQVGNLLHKQQAYIATQTAQNNTLFGFGPGSPTTAGGLNAPAAAAITPAEAHNLATHEEAHETVREPAEGLLTQTPLVSALERRRALDPAGFDARHPRLGPLLAEDVAIRAAAPSLDLHNGAAPQAPSRPAHHLNLSASQLTVPEPGTATLALALIGTTALARRRRR